MAPGRGHRARRRRRPARLAARGPAVLRGPDAARRDRRGRRDPRDPRAALHPVRRSDSLGLAGRLRQAGRQDRRHPGRAAHARVGLPAARDLPRARRGRRDGRPRRPPRAAADGQAGPQWLGARLRRGRDRRPAAQRDGELVRLRVGGAPGAVRHRHRGRRAGHRRRLRPARAARGRASARTAGSTTTRPATRPAPPSSTCRLGSRPPWPRSAPGSPWRPTRRSGCATSPGRT